jgi:subtilisin family serine protease
MIRFDWNPTNILRRTAVCVLAATVMSVARADDVQGRPVVPGELVVTVQPGVSEDMLLAQLRAKTIDATVVRHAHASNTWLVRLKTPNLSDLKHTNAALQSVYDLDGVIAAEPNIVYKLLESPNDPLVSTMTFLNRIGAQKAWDLTTKKGDVVVAVLDTGVMLEHEDIAPVLWKNERMATEPSGKDRCANPTNDLHGWNFVECNSEVSPRSPSERHGTHVAGILGAAGNNRVGGAGVAWKGGIRIMPLRMCVTDCSLFRAVSAINYAVAHGAKIINISWGSPNDATQLKTALENAGKAGVLVVTAAGNGDENFIGRDNDINTFYPASYDLPNIISVAALGASDSLAGFSNFGRKTVHLAAPGVQILAPIPLESSNAPGTLISGYKTSDGTSESAPMVSAAAALVLARHPGISLAALRHYVVDFGDPLSALANKTISGRRLNVAASLIASDAGPTASVSASNQIPVAEAASPGGAPSLSSLRNMRSDAPNDTPPQRTRPPFRDVTSLKTASGSLPSPDNFVFLGDGERLTEELPTKEFVVTLKPTANVEDVLRRFAEKFTDMEISYKANAYGDPGTHLFVIKSKTPSSALLKRLKASPDVQSASQNIKYQLQTD